MVRLALIVIVLWATVADGSAAPAFTCRANGDVWSVTGTIGPRMACALRCVLRDAGGNQDNVSCSPSAAPEAPGDPLCEGFLLGKRWTSATLVASECATTQPRP